MTAEDSTRPCACDVNIEIGVERPEWESPDKLGTVYTPYKFH